MPSTTLADIGSADAFPEPYSGNVYRKLGVVPLINCTATRSTYGGSNPTQRVLDAMSDAAHFFVDIDELAKGVGKSIAKLTGAQWGLVTAGSTAALALAAAACMAGNDPEAMLRLPYTAGFRHEVVVFKTHRFAYDMIMRQVGAKLVEVSKQQDLTEALSRNPAMICMLARAEEQGFLRLEDVKVQANGVPIVVDAASSAPRTPDPWITRGADLVIYSGGKCIRGPQSSGFLIGRKDLCQAAWLNGPPHYGVGRGMKIGKEEMIGAVTALEDWLAGRTQDDGTDWLLLLDAITRQLQNLPIRTEILPSNQEMGQIAPRLHVSWSAGTSISGKSVSAMVFERHRVKLQDFWLRENSLIVDPLNLQSRIEASIVGTAIAEAFQSSNAPSCTTKSTTLHEGVSGKWKITIQYLTSRSTHELDLRQRTDGTVIGAHKGRFGEGHITGSVTDNTIVLQSKMLSDPLPVFFEFKGTKAGGFASGIVATGAAMEEHVGPDLCTQFGTGTWEAYRI
ncbi:aminotransferase class V-fold PLP-dependent enzyme [Mesorhizobium sp. VK23B]|uniref:Aminotransferase class V-fold PLP-dependent enzyme n=1 Tax=Mesorhizobium dulcispinae TaxID=3072316 RepID=A0ABU4XP89_9HYPH|nr:MULTISPECIES: aminotransferase class V-fold PLP-dependent enzyme [unclassified Mesorhizobium]MDX8470163.1 aminotransferase class V-fold PLP-dependent enzyme [Mesorhizobium sp. VK23B]MDX8476561.1 aminotransferase class V-fold PLP-dependent enzyme [Mesorhizobium sp. VK23A]